jgi:hypothetical protein
VALIEAAAAGASMVVMGLAILSTRVGIFAA